MGRIRDLNITFIPSIKYNFLCKSDYDGGYFIVQIYRNLKGEAHVKGMGDDGVNYAEVNVDKVEYDNYGPVISQISELRFDFLWVLWSKNKV